MSPEGRDMWRNLKGQDLLRAMLKGELNPPQQQYLQSIKGSNSQDKAKMSSPSLSARKSGDLGGTSKSERLEKQPTVLKEPEPPYQMNLNF